MSVSAAEKAFRTAIKERAFAPAYYLFGEDDYLKSEALRDLVEAAVDPATRDFNLETLRADISPESLGSILGTPPMMADRRVVVLRDPAALKKDSRAVLLSYLERPSPDVL